MRTYPILRVLCTLLCPILCAVGACCPVCAQERSEAIPAAVNAGGAVLLEADSGRVLYEQHAHTRMPMASTTKIMTALVVLEACELQKTVCVDERAVGVEGSSVYLYLGERLTVEQLLYALMLSSANDAAAALAYEVAGSIEGFAALMNAKAAEIGVQNTCFQNPHGLDADGHYTTAYDLAVITAYALRNEDFVRIVTTEKKVIPLREQEGARVLRNHNKLLTSLDGCIGVKTGFTKKSGRCLVSATEREGVRLVCVTLNCPDDWRTHTALHESGFAAYERVTLAKSGTYMAFIPAVGGAHNELYLQTDADVSVILPREHGKIICQISAPHFAYAPVIAGEVMGEAVWTLDGEVIACTTLYAAYGIDQVKKTRTPFSWLRELLYMIKEIL